MTDADLIIITADTDCKVHLLTETSAEKREESESERIYPAARAVGNTPAIIG
ncbi:hypothetical protein JCM12296A_39100 [Desulfosarcina cetonica]